MKLLLSDKLGSWIRTGIATGGGFLVGKGIIDAEASTTITTSLVEVSLELISGLLLWGVAQGSSLLNKKNK